MNVKRIRLSLLCLAVCACGSAAAEERTENYPSGKVKCKYGVNAAGEKDGSYVEYAEDGEVRVRASYRKDKLNGSYSETSADGAEKKCNYKDGQLHGKYTVRQGKEDLADNVWNNGAIKTVFGETAFPRAPADLKATLKVIAGAEPAADEHEAALRALKAYRYVCGVPWKDVALDAELNRLAEAAAKLCDKVGRLDHTPPNPGMPEAEYQYGYKGTSSSNLFTSSGGGAMMEKSVHAYMNDSDPGNIDRVGHRRWCINPAMLKVGFGSAGNFSAMTAHDTGRKNAVVPTVAYPAPGCMPANLFGAGYAWSVSLDQKGFAPLTASAVKVKVYALSPEYVRDAEPLSLDNFMVETKGYGTPFCIIFLPKGADVSAGRYWVEIYGVRPLASVSAKKPAKAKKGGKGKEDDEPGLRYLVEFVDMNGVADGGKAE